MVILSKHYKPNEFALLENVSVITLCNMRVLK